MSGYCLGRRFLTRGSTRSARSGLTTNFGNTAPARASFSQRNASTKLIRSTATPWRRDASSITRRTRLYTSAKINNSLAKQKVSGQAKGVRPSKRCQAKQKVSGTVIGAEHKESAEQKVPGTVIGRPH